MSEYLTAENILRALPDVLREDEKMLALGTSIANTLGTETVNTEAAIIYSSIDTLPEAVLDILAYDFKVDWYDASLPANAKRAVIKDCFNVHRHLGTKGAVQRALSDIYPESIVEEWTDYNGNPFMFRIILNLTRQRIAVSHSEIVRAVNIYKSLRSHLEENTIIYRSLWKFGLSSSGGYETFTARLCGTYPRTALHGEIDEAGLGLDAGGACYVFSSVPCGTIFCGTN